MGIRIEGPSVIRRKGTYTWIAVGEGAIDPDALEWEVQWIDQDDPPAHYRDRILRLVVDPSRGRLSIMLKDNSHGSALVARAEVLSCDYHDLLDDPEAIIPECERER